MRRGSGVWNQLSSSKTVPFPRRFSNSPLVIALRIWSSTIFSNDICFETPHLDPEACHNTQYHLQPTPIDHLFMQRAIRNPALYFDRFDWFKCCQQAAQVR